MAIAQPLPPQTRSLSVAWVKLPDDFKLPDDPVDNRTQPALAAALTESLSQAGLMAETAITMTNYGVCASVNDKIVVKAPDWAYVAKTTVPQAELERSYTPHLQGDTPTIVMEFLSETLGDEYSIKPTYPPGKWFYYEAVLQVPYYVIFEPTSGNLEVYRRQENGRYAVETRTENGLHWIESMQVFLGVWQGTRQQRTGYWLRWWDAQGNLLLWGQERAEQETQRAEQEAQRAEQETQRAEQETQRAEQEAQRAEQETQRAEQEAQRAEQETQRAEQEAQRAEQEAQRAEQEAQRAEQEAQRAEQEAQRAEQEAQRAERLRAKLRAAGIEPED